MRFIGFTFLNPPRLRRSNPPAVALCTALLLLFSGVGAAAATPAPFSTFLLRNANIQAIGHYRAGNIYVAGNAFDTPIPGRAGDFFVARLDAAATRIACFVYLGGSGNDNGRRYGRGCRWQHFCDRGNVIARFPFRLARDPKCPEVSRPQIPAHVEYPGSCDS